MKIFWTPYAKRSLRETAAFLSVQWNDDIIDSFLALIDKRLDQVKINPEIAPRLRSTPYRRLVIHKHISLFYTYNKEYIKIVLLWDNRQNPGDLYNKLTAADAM